MTKEINKIRFDKGNYMHVSIIKSHPSKVNKISNILHLDCNMCTHFKNSIANIPIGWKLDEDDK